MFRRVLFLGALSFLASNAVNANVSFQAKSSIQSFRDDLSVSQIRLSSSQKKITDIQGGASGGQSTMSKSIFNLVKGIVGVGVLSLPSGTLICKYISPIVSKAHSKYVYFLVRDRRIR